MQQSGRRKYRKHPKPDQYAPAMPRSAYVIFSNSNVAHTTLWLLALTVTIETREDLNVKSLSFTEIAKLVGKNEQNLTTSENEPYERQAFDGKEQYTIELAEYMTTEIYHARPTDIPIPEYSRQNERNSSQIRPLALHDHFTTNGDPWTP